MYSEPLSPDDRAVEQALMLKQNAGGVAQEAQVATLLAVPAEKRNGFAQGRARQAGTNAAIESVALSVLGVVEAAPELSVKQTGDYSKGWNAARRRVLDDLGRLRGALVAMRRHHYTTKARPDTLLAEATFVEAVFHLWSLVDLEGCSWDIRTGLCVRHPRLSIAPQECSHDGGRKFLESLGLDLRDTAVSELWRDVQARAEHAVALAAELPEEAQQVREEEGGAGAAEQ